MSDPVTLSGRQRQVALLVAGCFFMEMLDGTIVTTAAPRIGRSLHVSSVSTGLIITAYFITVAVLIPLSGWLAARYGARRVFATAIVVFTLASLGCAASTSLGILVVMRVLQGAGGALMVPVGRQVVLVDTPKRQLLRLTAYLIWPGLIAPVIAPLAGGLITTYASWHWLFLINVPLGALALGVALRLIHGGPVASPPPLDRLGVLLTCTGLTGLTYAAHLASEPTIHVSRLLIVGVPTVILLAAAVAHLLRAPAPLVNLRTLRVPTFGASLSGAAVFLLLISSAPFLLPLLFQTVFGWTPVKSGALVLFIFVGNVGIKPATTPLLNRFGFRAVMLASTIGLAVTMFLFGFLHASTPLELIVGLAMLSGICRSVGMTCFSNLAFSEIAAPQMRDANTLFSTNQQLASGLAVALAAIAVRAGGPVAQLFGERADPSSAYAVAFALLALIGLIPVCIVLGLQPGAGDVLRTVSGRAVAPEPEP